MTGYTLTVTTRETTAEAADKVKALVNETFPADGAVRQLGKTLNGQSKFELVREHVKLSQVFAALEGAKEKLGVTDWGITETTLEEVFLHLMRNPVATMGGTITSQKGGNPTAVTPMRDGRIQGTRDDIGNDMAF